MIKISTIPAYNEQRTQSKHHKSALKISIPYALPVKYHIQYTVILCIFCYTTADQESLAEADDILERFMVRGSHDR